jgi:hypothetical protein
MQDNNVGYYWLVTMSRQLTEFITTPSQATKAALMAAMVDFQQAVAAGLKIQTNIPEPLRNAKTLTEWFRRNLDEALTMFRINPTDERLKAMGLHLDSYLDGFGRGRIEPW